MSATIIAMPTCRSCKSCNQTKPIDDFVRANRTARGLIQRRHWCKVCWNNRTREDGRNRANEARKDHRKRLLYSARVNAQHAGVPCNLTLADIVIPAMCPVLGIPLKGVRVTDPDNMPSLDRLIPSLGYVRGNVHVISMRANRIKQNGSAKEHMLIATWMRSLGAE